MLSAARALQGGMLLNAAVHGGTVRHATLCAVSNTRGEVLKKREKAIARCATVRDDTYCGGTLMTAFIIVTAAVRAIGLLSSVVVTAVGGHRDRSVAQQRADHGGAHADGCARGYVPETFLD